MTNVCMYLSTPVLDWVQYYSSRFRLWERCVFTSIYLELVHRDDFGSQLYLNPRSLERAKRDLYSHPPQLSLLMALGVKGLTAVGGDFQNLSYAENGPWFEDRWPQWIETSHSMLIWVRMVYVEAGLVDLWKSNTNSNIVFTTIVLRFWSFQLSPFRLPHSSKTLNSIFDWCHIAQDEVFGEPIAKRIRLSVENWSSNHHWHATDARGLGRFSSRPDSGIVSRSE